MNLETADLSVENEIPDVGSVNGGVEHRYMALVNGIGAESRRRKPEGSLPGEVREREFDGIDLAMKQAAGASQGSTSFSDIIKIMVKEVFQEYKVSLPEFVERFRDDGLAEELLGTLDRDLAKIELQIPRPVNPVPDEQLRKVEMLVLAKVRSFLDENKLQQTATVYRFLVDQKKLRPMLDLKKLLTIKFSEQNGNGQHKMTNLREKIVQKINDSVEQIAADAYREKFAENNKDFVLESLMGPIIAPDKTKKRMGFNHRKFLDLMEYLDKQKASIARIGGQSLYDLLYEESREMAKHHEELRVEGLIDATGNSVTGVINETPRVEGGEKLFYEPGFDVKAFYDRHIARAIMKFYSKKQLSKKENLRITDLFQQILDPSTQGKTNYTVLLIKFAKDLVETSYKDPKLYMEKVRELLGLKASVAYPDLSDEAVKNHFRFYLAKAADKFRITIGDALYYRLDSEAKTACTYPKPILLCTDPLKLMEWFIYPDQFRKENPDFKDLPDDQITYMSGAFLRDFLNVLNQLSSQEFAEAEVQRDWMEENEKQRLQIEVIKDLDVNFRVLVQLDEKGQETKPPRYEWALNNNDLLEFAEGLDQDLSKKIFEEPTLQNLSWKGKEYKVLSTEEQKHFKMVRMRIPLLVWDKKERVFRKQFREVVALVYTGDNHLIHVKDELTRVISTDRGKEVSDVHRWMWVFKNPQDLDAFSTYIYDNYPFGLIKVEDNKEDRHITYKNKVSKGTKSTGKFKENQEFAHTGRTAYPVHGPGDKIFVTHPMLETKCMTLKEILLALSAYTDRSHDVYKSQRAWPLLFSMYFPPQIFGDRFKEIEKQGCDYQNAA